MIHPDDGRLRALLDDDLDEAESAALRAHLRSCQACDAAASRAQETQVLATALLDALDIEPPTARVRARLAERRRAAAASTRARPRFPLGRADLARAALLLLGFSGAVAAAVHPASPLRRWLAQEERAARAPAPVDAPATAAAPAREVGVRMAMADGEVRVTLEGAGRGSSIAVTWVEGTSSAAAVYAPEGTGFTTSEAQGRIEARLPGPGRVRIELPRGAARASLQVDGVGYLEKRGERIDFPGPPALVDGPRVEFQLR